MDPSCYVLYSMLENAIKNSPAIVEVKEECQHYKNYITPQMFGAKGDGINDDTIALKLLIERAKETNRTIYIPKGTYNITQRIVIDNVRMVAANGSIIDAVECKDTTEHIIVVTGSSSFDNITFRQSCDVSLMGLASTNNVQFTHCSFLVNGVSTNGYVDLYSNNHNVTFDDCTFNCNSKTIGGIWIREYKEDTTSENIHFIDCDFTHSSSDECIASWDWHGTVEEIYIEHCFFHIPKTNKSNHIFGLDYAIITDCFFYVEGTHQTLFKTSEVEGNMLRRKTLLQNCKVNVSDNFVATTGLFAGSFEVYSFVLQSNKFIILNNTDIVTTFFNSTFHCGITFTKNAIFHNCTFEFPKEAKLDYGSFYGSTQFFNCVIRLKGRMNRLFRDMESTIINGLTITGSLDELFVITGDVSISNVIATSGRITVKESAEGYFINSLTTTFDAKNLKTSNIIH